MDMNLIKSGLVKWLVTFMSFIVVDLLWLGVIAKPVYDHYLEAFLRDGPNWPAALVFYTLFIIGIIYFALNPALKEKSKSLALKNGVLFGFFTYMTYELTNFAVLEGWPFGIVIIDIVWGSVLGGLTSLIAFTLLNTKVVEKLTK